MVEQDNANIAAVIFVDDSSSDVDEILDGQARSWGNATVAALWELDLDVSLDDELATSRNNAIVSAVEKKLVNLSRTKESRLANLFKSNPAAFSEPFSGANALSVSLAKRRTVCESTGILINFRKRRILVIRNGFLHDSF